MTLTTKDSTQPSQASKPGAPSQNSEKNSGQTTRSNPVCLEVEITIRSLPGEAGSLSQPIREGGKTVIVFDNGAVIRSATTLPAGLKVILSNSKGRDVVCQVSSGRNSAHIKGYVEVEFLEPVSDFWHIHEDIGPVPAALPAPPLNLHEPLEPASAGSLLAASSLEGLAKPLISDTGSAPSFDDIPGLLSTPLAPAAREPKSEHARPGFGVAAKANPNGKEESDYNLSEIAKSTSLANWDLPGSGANQHGRTLPGPSETAPPATPAAARDFMSKGLMAFEQAPPPANAKNGRIPLMVGAAVLAVAAVCGAAFYLHRGSAPSTSVAKIDVQSQPPAPVSPPANSSPDPGLAPQQDAPGTQSQNAAQSIASAPSTPLEAQPASVSNALPDIVIGPATENARSDSRNAQRQEKKAAENRKTEAAAPARPAIQNLKMSSPVAPQQGRPNSSDAAAPIADIAASAGPGAATPAGLLSSAGRTSKPPVPPPGATVVFDTATMAPAAAAPATPAPAGIARTVTSSPKLISSAHVIYPTTAKQSRIEGTVSLSLSLDAAGNVVAAKPLSGPAPLRPAAADSAKQWKYSPAMQDGKPVASQIIVNVDFRLQ